jgi:hypothetical protein
MFKGVSMRNNLIFQYTMSFIFAFWIVFSPSALGKDSTEGIFTSLSSSGAATDSKISPNVVRSRVVSIDFEKLNFDKYLLTSLNLFSDFSVDARFDSNLKNNSGSRTWIGKVPAIPNSSIFLIIKNETMFGRINLPGIGQYSIQPIDEQSHLIEQAITDQQPNLESDAMIPETSVKARATLQNREVAISSDDGSIIDVYVAYDQDAIGGAVTSTEAEAYAELFIAFTNQAYKNSGIEQRVWLVGVGGFNHNDSNHSSVHSDLLSVTNGEVPGVYDKRNQTHADLVMFLTPFSNTCNGSAWVQTTNNDVSWNLNGYSAMTACPYGEAVFAHELGHNMGSNHDWYVDSDTSPATIAHGYIDMAQSFRTIMSYSNRCSALGEICDRIPYFSNPAINYNGVATGVAQGTSSSCVENDATPSVNCDADNKTNFDAKAPITSKFRDSRITWTGANGSNWSDAANWTMQQGSPGSTRATNLIPRSFDNVYIPTGLSTYPVITSSAFARELVIEDGAKLDMSAGVLSVGWSWEDSGGFTATGGTVELAGPVGVVVTSDSVFNNLRVGTGSDSTQVSLESNLDIDGDFFISSGATLSAGSHKISLAGNWSENNVQGFIADSSTVILDGENQIINKVTNQNNYSENFNAGDNNSCCTTIYLPSDWTVGAEGAWYGGELDGSGRGIGAGDGWLFSGLKSYRSGVSYTLSFDFSRYYGSGSIKVYLGNDVHSSSMSQLLGVISSDGAASFSFDTPVSGEFYLGFHHVTDSDDDWSYIDNVLLSSTQGLKFYNLDVDSGVNTFQKDVAVVNNLQINQSGVFDILSTAVTVDGVVINNGTYRQTKLVPPESTTVFAEIKSSSGSVNKYKGVDISPSGVGMGSTVVEVRGNQTCSSDSSIVIGGVKRCYQISPSTSQPSAVKFYYGSSEVNVNNNPSVYRITSSNALVQEVVSGVGSTANFSWVATAAVSNFGFFSVSSITSGTRPPAERIPYYRLYNSNNGDHHYTQNFSEYNSLGNVGWTKEGVAYYIYDSPVTINDIQAQPWQRLYNPNSSFHHWTLSGGEYDALGAVGWSKEGVAGYFFDVQVPESVPLYRVYNDNDGTHHWTKDQNEYGFLISVGWNDEGIAGYVFNSLN